MKKIFITAFLLAGIISIYLGLNVDLKCVEATMRDNILAGLPLLALGVYCLLTSIFLWLKPQIGNILAVISVTAAGIMIIASIFDLSFPIIKTYCPLDFK